MGGVALLERAHDAGLTVRADADRLVVRGPKSADALARELLTHKRGVLRMLEPWRPPRTVAEVDDPRPDLAADSTRWQTLLRAAWLEPDADEADGTFGALHGVRCAGAVLIVQPNGAYRLEAGRRYLGEWGVDRARWLMPRRDTIASLLRRLAAADGELGDTA